ncbi:hypothetical protein V8C86DRAFT_2465797 [Haematococcus lacustris]
MVAGCEALLLMLAPGCWLAGTFLSAATTSSLTDSAASTSLLLSLVLIVVLGSLESAVSSCWTAEMVAAASGSWWAVGSCMAAAMSSMYCM